MYFNLIYFSTLQTNIIFRFSSTNPGFRFSMKSQCSLVPNLLNQPIRFLSFPAYSRNRQDTLGLRRFFLFFFFLFLSLACNCDRRGSFTLTCRSADGQCPCLRNYGERDCSKCQIGFYDFPYCRNCNCHSAGIVVSKETPTGCYKNNPVSCYLFFYLFTNSNS